MTAGGPPSAPRAPRSRWEWWREELRSVFVLHEGPWRWAAGSQAAFAMGVPMAAFALAGHRAQGLVASMGAFTALYLASTIVAVRVVVAVAVASIAAIPIGIGHAYWAVMVAGVVLQVTPSLRHATVRVVHRVVGTLIGVAAFGLVALIAPSGLALILLVAARNHGLGLILITPLSLAIATAGNVNQVGTIVTDRIVDTLLGAAIALAVLGAGAWLGRRLTIPALST